MCFKKHRGGELKCYIHTYIHTDRHTDRHTDPLTKWVVEELSLLKSVPKDLINKPFLHVLLKQKSVAMDFLINLSYMCY